jgi:glycosyltransferase involved in cell wall biosynthesis
VPADAPSVVPEEIPTTLLRARPIRNRRTWIRIAGLERALHALQPDIVHVHAEPWSLAAVQSVRAQGDAVVVHGVETIYDQGGGLEAGLRLRVARSVLRRAGGFMGWADIVVAAARASGLPADTPVGVASPIVPDPDLYASARANRAATRQSCGVTKETVLTFVGRLVPEKGLDWLRRSFDALPDDEPRRLWIIGDGPRRDSLDAWASVDARVSVLGRLDAARIATLMAASDRVLVPSLTTDRWEEQFGRVAVEGCLAGTPVIASASGALPEVLGPTGEIVPEHDVAALSAALAAARPREVDATASTAALAWATDRYAPEVVAQHLVDLWTEVRARRKPRTTGMGD